MDTIVAADPIVSIYALLDPETGLIRYIGKAADPEKRLRQHLAPWNLELKSRKNSWLKGLGQRSLRPELVVLQTVPAEEADEAERWWIAAWKPSGWLTNGTDGGEGNSGFSQEVRDRLGWRKIDAAEVKEIRERFAAGEDTVTLAEEFGVTRHTIGNVVRGKTWSNAGGPVARSLGQRVHGRSDLSDEQVREMRELAAEGASYALLEHRFGVNSNNISRILSGQSRAAAGGPIRPTRPRQKLTEADVEEIRRRIKGGESQTSVAIAFGVTSSRICQLLRGR